LESPKIIIGNLRILLKIMGVSNEKLETSMGVSKETSMGVSYENLGIHQWKSGFSNENLGVSNEMK